MSQIQIPKGWKVKTVEEICEKITSGGTPSRDNQKYFGGNIPWVKMTDLKTEYIFQTEESITEEGLANSSAKLFPKDTILVAMYTADMGKTAILGIEAATNQAICGLQCKKEVIPKFLYYFLKSQTQNIKKLGSGGAQPNINQAKIKSLTIPVPDKDIQTKVVQKLDYIIGQLEQKKKEILNLSNLENIRHIVSRNIEYLLQTALEGKLTREWRHVHKANLESASALLEQILMNRRKKFEYEKQKHATKKSTDPKFKTRYKVPLTPDSNLPELPNLWTWVTLDQITWSIKDGPHYSPEYVEDGIPFITGGNVRPSGIDFVNAKKISHKLHIELSKRCKPEKNDILYTKGGTTGIARVNTYEQEFSVWVHVAVLKLVNPIEPFYVQHALNSPFCYSQAQNFTHGVGNQDLGLTRMIRIVLPLPPLEEQVEITRILHQKFLELESVNSKINEIISKKQLMIDYLNKTSLAIFNEGFTGKLAN